MKKPLPDSVRNTLEKHLEAVKNEAIKLESQIADQRNALADNERQLAVMRRLALECESVLKEDK